jgi:hypothetical protein
VTGGRTYANPRRSCVGRDAADILPTATHFRRWHSAQRQRPIRRDNAIIERAKEKARQVQ